MVATLAEGVVPCWVGIAACHGGVLVCHCLAKGAIAVKVGWLGAMCGCYRRRARHCFSVMAGCGLPACQCRRAIGWALCDSWVRHWCHSLMSLVFGCYVWVLYWVGGTFGRTLLAMSGHHVSVFKNKKNVCAIWGLCCSVIFQSLVFRLGFSSLHVWKPKTACLDELDFGVQPSSADPRFHRELSPSILHDNWQCGPGTIHVPCAEHFGTETDGSL